MKRTPMPARSRPMRRAAISRTGGLLRRVGLANQVRRRRASGFDRATTAIIMDRDGTACVVAIRCDGTPGTAQTVNHIVNRGNGGSSDPAAHDVTNGIAVCQADNGWLEDHPLVAYSKGWKQRHGHTGPVLYVDGWWTLLPDGTRRPA